MKNGITLTIFGALLAMMSSLSFAQVTVYAYEIPGLYQEDSNGVYDQIVTQLIVEEGHADLQVLPGITAEKQFRRCTNCCITPANLNPQFYRFPKEVVATDPMNVAEIYIFTKHGSTPIGDIDKIEGMRVGVRRSMITSLQSVLRSGSFRMHPADTITQLLSELDEGTIQAYIDFVPDVYAVANDLGIEPPSHTKGMPLDRHPDALACKGVSADFIQGFNSGLQKMQDNGQLKQILGDSQIIP